MWVPVPPVSAARQSTRRGTPCGCPFLKKSVAVSAVVIAPFVAQKWCAVAVLRERCRYPPVGAQKVLPLPFFAALRGQKGVALAVLRPFVDDKGCCRCRSSTQCPSPTKKVLPLPFFGVLRSPSWTKGVAVAVLRSPSWTKRCCRCRSPRPFAALRGQKVLPLPFSAALRGPSGQKGVAVAVLRGPSRTKGVAVAVLRSPSWTKRCCRCRSSRSFAALRGQKVLPLPFSAALRGQKGVAVAVLRGPRPFADKRCCRCRSSQPFAALRGQKVLQPLPFSAALRGPPWTKGSCRCRSPRPFVDKKVLPCLPTGHPHTTSRNR